MKPFCFRRRGNSPPLRLLMSAFSAQLCPPARWATFIPFAGYSATPRIWRLGQGFGEAGGGALRLCRLPRPPGLPTREFGWPTPGPSRLMGRQTGFQGDNYYRPVTFSAPSLGNVPCQTTGACLGQPWPPDLLQLTYAAAGGPLGSRPGGCPGRPMACHLATGSRDLGLPRDRASAWSEATSGRGKPRLLFALEPWKASLWEEQGFR